MPVINQLTDLKIEILSRCPLRCVHCSSESSSDCNEFVTPSQVRSVISEFVRLDGKQIEVSGGEPLEHPNLLEILDIIRTENISTTVYTTGLLMTQGGGIRPIDDNFAAELRRRVRSLVFSLQAGEASIHDSFTGVTGSFEATLAAIKVCQAAGIDVALHFVPTQENYDSLPALILLMKRQRIERLSLLRFVPHGRGKGSSLALSMQQHIALREMVSNIASDKKINIRLGSPYSMLQTVDVPTCRAGVDRMLISPDGTAYPCDAYKGFRYEGDSFSNVYEVGLRVVWTKSLFFRHARKLARQVPKACRDCVHESYCHGGCPAQRAFEYSELKASHTDPCCLQFPRLF